jgi:Tfp pilus tip-associated adhesin PilY1
MSPETSRLKAGRIVLCILVLASALLVCGRNAFADDRDLLRASVSKPYVFIVLDTSGSMHWSPTCTQAQLDAGDCSVLCPTGDCFVPMNGDDPSSKLYQAKEALYEVIKGIDNVQFGFATYNQDSAYMRTKHYIYKAKANGPVITGFGAWPAINSQEVFGQVWPCTSSDSNGCAYASPADSTDAWEVERIKRVPKAGISLTDDVTVWLRYSGNIYRIKYHPVSGAYGSDIKVNIKTDRCTSSSSCNTAIGTLDVDFAYVNEFGSWDNGADKTNPTLGYFDQGDAADTNASNTCTGWDPTTDTTADKYNSYSIRFPTTTDARGSFFDFGDVIPLDWNNRHQQDILNRLAPNVVANVNATPDFRTAFYFKNARTGAETFLRLKDEAQRPLMASGSTPLGNSVKAFRTWWAGCSTASACPPGGWEKVAAAQDAEFSCRRKFLLVLTDGDETCSGDPCGWTGKLLTQEGIKTYVVAFGIQNQSGNVLNCMAANGGSGAPIYPQNKQELIDALTNIFSQIREEASAFASAAVPSVQAEVADRIFLSSFTPLNGVSVWDGHLDAYLKPLPLTVDGKPARSLTCPPDGSSSRSSCHLWDAGVELLAQAPERTTMDMASSLSGSVLKLGTNSTDRRVFYGKKAPASGIGWDLRLLMPPVTTPSLLDADWTDIWSGFDITVNPLNLNAAKTTIETIIKQTLQIKDSQIEKADGTIVPIRYVLGDIFHSDPAIIDRPSEFGFYSGDLFGIAGSTSCVSNPGYRCWADKHKYRRKMLVVGSNDSQLHFFDGGVWDPTKKKFGDGSGREIFSYIPRLAMPIVRDLAQDTRQIFGIDSTARLDDVYIDPKHTGTPTATEREWRTIVLGGFREGGKLDAGGGTVPDFTSGYYAIDVTQPDQLQTDKTPIDTRIVPSCLSQTNSTVSGCGTLPFPGLLWEFTDSISGSRLDEDDTNANGVPDGNGYADLGQTWSVPTIGRIRVKEGGTPTYKFVAIFGGGLDPVAANKTSPKSGNWLYMVDIETGQAIYKRQLPGAVPSDPAVLDTDLDGYLDTIYVGTTAGYLYKVDISAAADLVTTTLSRNWMIPHLLVDPQVKRIQGWDPFPIFNTLGKPIYFPPTAFYISKISRFALAFGTGDRENLWAETGLEGRFYLIVDDNFVKTDATLPKDETKYKKIEADDAPQAAGSDFVINPPTGLQRGWYLRLDPDERIITQAFGLSGIVIFSGYTPTQPEIDPSGVCSRGGDSRIFVVYANNADAIMTIYDPDTPTDPGVKSRSRTVPEFVTNPYVEQGATKNPGDNAPPANSEQLDATQQQIMEALKQFCPPESKFANYWISVSGIRSDTGYERYATVPICIVERQWKEH